MELGLPVAPSEQESPQMVAENFIELFEQANLGFAVTAM